MHAFLCNFTPRSVNAKRKTKYYSGLINAFKKYHGTITPLNDKLYGFVYYFHRIRIGLDADNLSKPIWDALASTAYIDDDLISFRSAGVFDLKADNIKLLNLSNIPDYLLEDFLDMIDNEDHFLYVEIGNFDYSLFHFDHEG